jgi:hypothetical protein
MATKQMAKATKKATPVVKLAPKKSKKTSVKIKGKAKHEAC